MRALERLFCFPHVSCRFGAPMGRSNATGDGDACPRLKLRAVPMVDGAYDPGGAYWGGWTREHGRMFVAWNERENVRVFVRARSRGEAKALVRQEIPGARFYR